MRKLGRSGYKGTPAAWVEFLIAWQSKKGIQLEYKKMNSLRLAALPCRFAFVALISSCTVPAFTAARNPPSSSILRKRSQPTFARLSVNSSI